LRNCAIFGFGNKKALALEMAVEHPGLLNNVTVAVSFNVNPMVGVKFVVLGEGDWMLKLVKLGATLSNATTGDAA
jgi:hypothetical protein